MLTLVTFFLILSLLILVHELGHFVAAKMSGVLVEEFGLGLPPRLFGKKVGETIYSINLLPFGGFVKLFGEDSHLKHPRSFMHKTVIKRTIIISAGVVMNVVLGLAMYYALFTFTGKQALNIPLLFDYRFPFGEVSYTNTVISGFTDETNAERSGVSFGDAIYEIDGVPVYNVLDVRKAMEGKVGGEVSLLVKDMRIFRSDQIRTVNVKPVVNEDGDALLGVYLSKSVNIRYKSLLMSAPAHAYNMLAYTYSTFKEFISISFATKSVEPVSAGVAGPVGIYTIVGAIVSQGGFSAFLSLLDLTALMSISLALLNILPLPALDGGRLVFIIMEGILGKRVNQKFETSVHKWGIIFFLFLFFLVTIKDVSRLF